MTIVNRTKSPWIKLEDGSIYSIVPDNSTVVVRSYKDELKEYLNPSQKRFPLRRSKSMPDLRLETLEKLDLVVKKYLTEKK